MNPSIKICKLLFLLLFTHSFFACASLRDSGVPAPEMDSTETGIATGVVIGAGIGALVGSTAGQPGTGAILGGVAGGTTGGVIGHALETQEKRIDIHDQKLGVDTTPTGGASIRSRLWSQSDELDFESNRPSGTKGIAAQYVAPVSKSHPSIEESTIEIKRVPVDPVTLSSTSLPVRQIHQVERSKDKPVPQNSTIFARNNESLPIARTVSPGRETPRIELQKPRPELPKMQHVPPVRRPTLSNNVESKKVNDTFVARGTSDDSGKVTEKAHPQIASKTQSRAMIEAPVAASVSRENAIGSPARKPQEVSTCSKGKNEIQRARNAASDSDKVFYLRRAILACPQDSSLRVELGKVYSRLGLKDDARKEFNAALDHDPSNESAQDELSIMMLESHSSR
jgi:hypothetical protein